MARRTFRLAVLAGLLIGGGSPTMAAGGAAPLLAHRAVYEMTLGKTSGAKAPAAARGRIALDFTGSACEGWSMTFRQAIELQPAEGATRVSDTRSTTFEDGEGKSFRFHVRTEIDGVEQQESDGEARRNPDGAISVALRRPRRASLEFAPGVIFPTEQMIRVIAAARAGESTYETPVFDGSDSGEKALDTFTVIGAPIASEAPESAARNDALRGMRRWPTHVSYFERGKKDGAPVYSLAFDLFENGVSRALRLDYGDFVLEGELTKFEPLPMRPCPK